MRRWIVPAGLLSLALAGTAALADKPWARGPSVIVDDDGSRIRVDDGKAGDPGQLGCADGQREAFSDARRYPDIAGCLASWDGLRSLRARATGRPCGDDGPRCAVPADACARGWHLCGADGRLAELRALSGEACENAGNGRFSAAVSHCLTQEGCVYDDGPDARYACFDAGWCSEAVCCGRHCASFGACPGGVWTDRTHIQPGTDQGCGRISAQRAGGVLCCRDRGDGATREETPSRGDRAEPRKRPRPVSTEVPEEATVEP